MKSNALFVILVCNSLALPCLSQTQPPSISDAPAAIAVGVSTPPQSGTVTSSNDTDPQALNVINKSIAAMGGSQSAAVRDFTATGDIAYYWAGKEENGSATIRGRGADDLRFDAAITGGTRSWVVNGGAGTLRDVNGKTTRIPYHNAITLGGLIFPLARLQALSADAKASFSYEGTANVEQQSFEHLRAHKNLLEKDPDGSANRLMDADLYFDPNTHLLLGLHDQTHPSKSMTVDTAHAFYFGDYRQVNGVLVPFTVSEYVGGQRVWSLQISEIKLNSGLTDADFQLQ